MKNYECIKELCLDKVDGDGFTIPNEYSYIPVGSLWYADTSSIIGGEIHLESKSQDADFGWIEITKEHLGEYFKEID